MLYFFSEGQKPVDIHRKMKNVYREAYMKKTHSGMVLKVQSSSLHLKQFQSQSSVVKMMLSHFFYFHGPLLIDFKDPCVSITGDLFREALEWERREIKAKSLGQLRNGVLFLNNARPHVTNAIKQKFHSLNGETLEHLL